jgi:hypothetical protein
VHAPPQFALATPRRVRGGKDGRVVTENALLGTKRGDVEFRTCLVTRQVVVDDVDDAQGHWRDSRRYRIMGSCGDGGSRHRGARRELLVGSVFRANCQGIAIVARDVLDSRSLSGWRSSVR